LFPASNLLSSTPTVGKKWKCELPGEPSVEVVLLLEKPSTITAIDIGNEHSAFVEVLVSKNGSPNYQQILLTSSFMSPMESRNSDPANRVRCFGRTALVDTVVESKCKWDLVKIICTQPFNKRVQYGLSFITLHSTDAKGSKEAVNEASSIPKKMFGNFKIREDSPESDSESPQSLFSRWKMSRNGTDNKDQTQSVPLCAAAAIREATTASLKNYSWQINRQAVAHKGVENRFQRDEDEVVQEKDRNRSELIVTDELKETDTSKKKIKRRSSSPLAVQPVKKMKETKEHIYRPFNKLLEGVVLVISGIQNPARATIRQQALDMGAKYKPDWESSCTHLICAFKNTPKYQQVQGHGKIVTKDWIMECHKKRRRIPWRRFALDSDDGKAPESEDEIFDKSLQPTAKSSQRGNYSKTESDTKLLSQSKQRDTTTCVIDTEDEVNRVLEKKNSSIASRASDEIYNATTDEDVIAVKSSNSTSITPLPEFFKGKCFYLSDNISSTDEIKLKRFISVYGGEITLDAIQSDYIVSNTPQATHSNYKGEVVKPLWIFECNDLEMLLPTKRMSEIVEPSEIVSKMDGLTLQEEGASVKIKRPKRVLHFSDGVIEEYSTDDENENEDVVDNDSSNNVVDESKLSWGPWLSLKAYKTGGYVLAGCDYVGETLASFVGITTHKYSYEIEQFQKMKEQEAEQQREDKEVGSFIEKTDLNDATCVTEQEQVKKY
ncbi:DNA repair protein XRCC1, partial [Pseudolycoriella hygida]